MSDERSDAAQLAPNHHADHPGFSGVRGRMAAMSMRFGRGRTAGLACDLVELEPGDRLVDIGCGPGVAARRAAARGATVTGVDPAEVMLHAAARDDRQNKVRWEQGTAEALPLDDATCDVAWALATVHHWADLEASLAEVARVLVDDGRFLAVERLTVPGAKGLASHGWTRPQSDTFAELCRASGFVEVAVSQHRAGRRHLLAVLARRAER
jgi:ubiquinone/menaquinone biosynthesis C-methylase UbiE